MGVAMTDSMGRYWDIEGCQWVRWQVAAAEVPAAAEEGAVPEQRAVAAAPAEAQLTLP
jgi:hypothetical protein